jgi:signal peptidase I
MSVLDNTRSYYCISELDIERLLRLLEPTGTCVTFKACGRSMLPFIRSGSRIYVRPVKTTSDLSMGRVVLFQKKGCQGLFGHRIIDIKKNGYLIKGDNCTRPDGYYPAHRILGLVSGMDNPVGAFILKRQWIGRKIAALSKAGVSNQIIGWATRVRDLL